MTNKLAQSTSPYLQQHADNPVQWHEWGPEALQLSIDSDKPILLSVGYSACHWCHVMAHESFEDVRIAETMNRLFVNIKVDREERPDIDQIYQTAHAILTRRSGGWPLTMFLTPDMRPFFGGTYFPKSARYGLPGFGDLLTRVANYYRDYPDNIKAQGEQLVDALRGGTPDSPAVENTVNMGLTREPIDAGLVQMARSFDGRCGGFGSAPKFPHPEMIEFCLRRFAEKRNAQTMKTAREIACFTLERMCKGGIFDQLGGGFARYSVDDDWSIPHFEKMLYDNGPLLRLLADAWLVSESIEQKALFKHSAEQTAAWVMRELQTADDGLPGGFYSSLDADSDGHEGKYYVWTRQQFEQLLTPPEYNVVARHFGLDGPANFEDCFWNLRVTASLTEVASSLDLPVAQCESLLVAAKLKLFVAREKRIRPGRDEKILTSWNAMMIEAMAHAGRVFGRSDWLASARRAITFARNHLWNPDTQRLYATHKDGKSHLNAYLDDYAFLLKALIEMLQAELHVEDLEFAKELADVMLEQFEDAVYGGFFFTSHDHEQLIQRPKPGRDNATPSGNGVAALALSRLSHLANEPRYADASRRTLCCFLGQIEEHPAAFGSLLVALEELLNPIRLVILTGPEEELVAFRTGLASTYLPSTVVIVAPSGISGLPPFLSRPATGEVNAYVCQGVTCLAPLQDFAKLQETLKMPIGSA